MNLIHIPIKNMKHLQIYILFICIIKNTVCKQNLKQSTFFGTEDIPTKDDFKRIFDLAKPNSPKKLFIEMILSPGKYDTNSDKIISQQEITKALESLIFNNYISGIDTPEIETNIREEIENEIQSYVQSQAEYTYNEFRYLIYKIEIHKLINPINLRNIKESL